MGVLTWILLGLIAGFIASRIVNHHGSGALLDVVIGMFGALLGGWVFSALGSHGISGFNFHSLLVAVAGSVLVLAAFHLVRRTQ